MDNNIYKIRENGLTYGRGYVYSLQYHIVWCTKYRKRVLQDGIDTDLKRYLLQMAKGIPVYDRYHGDHAGSYPYAGGLQSAVRTSRG